MRRPRSPLLSLMALPHGAFLPWFHDIRIAPYHEALVRHDRAVRMKIRIKRSAIADIAVARCDVVYNATDRKGTLEGGRAACARVALVVHGDARPAEHFARTVRGTGSIFTHALCRDVRRDDLTPICFDRGWKKGFRV